MKPNRLAVLAGSVMLSAAIVLAASPARAADLTVALATPLTSLDPHYHNLTPNNGAARHVFDTLLMRDADTRIIPGLAESWRAIDNLTWEFKLRRNVKFHDGSAFTAEDVLATMRRIPKVPRSPSPFTRYVKGLNVSTPDPYTLVMKTDKPHPLLPSDMSSFLIISKKFEQASTEDFNSGKAMVGTGPFRFVSYKPGDRLVLARNDAYWGAKPAWAKAELRMITNSAARVAALLAGDVQMIENVPTADTAKLRADKRLTVAGATSVRLIYLHMDHFRDKDSPHIFDKAGKPLGKNPLLDVRVRRAISMAIDRKAIVDRIMEGVAEPAGQLLAPKFFGTSQKLAVPAHDPQGAKKLLAEAGYPDGFAITLHATNNRYINDSRIAQAIAQYLTRVGIQTKLEAMPSAVFFPKGTRGEVSFLMAGWGAESADTSSPLLSLIATPDKALGTGAANRGRYSNPGLDAMVTTAMTQIDDTKRGLLLAAASERAMEQLPIIPLLYEVSVWGMRKGVQYKARADQYTFAFEARPGK